MRQLETCTAGLFLGFFFPNVFTEGPHARYPTVIGPRAPVSQPCKSAVSAAKARLLYLLETICDIMYH